MSILRRKFSVSGEQSISAGGLRTIVTHKTVLRADLDMTGAASIRIDQHRADRRGIRIADRQFLKAVIAHQLVTGLFGVSRFWIRIDRTRRPQRFFYITPASLFRFRVGALSRQGRGAEQSPIEPRIDPGQGMGYSARVISANDLRGLRLPTCILKGELRRSRPGDELRVGYGRARAPTNQNDE